MASQTNGSLNIVDRELLGSITKAVITNIVVSYN